MQTALKEPIKSKNIQEKACDLLMERLKDFNPEYAQHATAFGMGFMPVVYLYIKDMYRKGVYPYGVLGDICRAIQEEREQKEIETYGFLSPGLEWLEDAALALLPRCGFVNGKPVNPYRFLLQIEKRTLAPGDFTFLSPTILDLTYDSRHGEEKFLAIINDTLPM
jgi:hypothetical protein